MNASEMITNQEFEFNRAFNNDVDPFQSPFKGNRHISGGKNNKVNDSENLRVQAMAPDPQDLSQGHIAKSEEEKSEDEAE